MDDELILTKHHGLGNDFLVVLDMANSISLGHAEIVALLDRRFGVGADGLMHVTPAPADSPSVAQMTLYNSDGSQAELSGNGIRCLAQALIDSGSSPVGAFSIDTAAGAIEIESHSKSGEPVATISVGMGTATMSEAGTRSVGGQVYRSVRVDIGNPHLVLFPAQQMTELALAQVDIALLGPEVESEFPGGMNVEWVLPNKNGREMTLRVWERGAGITQACGTGSTASAFAARQLGLVEDSVVVHNPGGDLTIRIDGDRCFLTGPAQKVCDVTLTLGQLEAMAAPFK